VEDGGLCPCAHADDGVGGVSIQIQELTRHIQIYLPFVVPLPLYYDCGIIGFFHFPGKLINKLCGV